MGCGESKPADVVVQDTSDIRRQEAKTVLAELERIQSEGAVRLRQAQEHADNELAQCKAAGEQRLREEEARIHSRLSEPVGPSGEDAAAEVRLLRLRVEELERQLLAYGDAHLQQL